jgi:hypothetical protein
VVGVAAAVMGVLKLRLPVAAVAAGRVLQLQQALAPLLKGFQAVMAMKQVTAIGLVAAEVEHQGQVMLVFQVVQAMGEMAGQESQA